ncbi:30S ribosomal protein S17 [Candidatus Uhrbacteria bacterium CG10_big_fil_rev_8_21_14_0_10_50_16]|uniref:Small ribosomal subunit protein uS17 n=1 Tax=Candidatus Uhrbacteria bacterium CG10_big_fil_rev_8_21_14_0_10_50_16 TaxID=1975039 RepID=A0A2H0RM33_9BACT|nr:MAG: 30S ribosomal protein S17 [Candidatus Uhrbacteria bacterium CG10_big_fil_rev_8_21_14_0_10_50_16]
MTNKTTNRIIRRRFTGTVVSDRMDKTVVVRVDSPKMHPKYKKRYTTSKKYKVHDEENQCAVGDTVSFVECRPLSKDKRWRIVRSADSAAVTE